MNRSLLKALLITTAIVIIYSFIFIPFGVFSKARAFSMDLTARCVYSLSDKPPQADDIVIISVDRESLRRLKRRWPWSRGVFAELLERMERYDTKVVYVDFSFIGETSEDEYLAKAMSTAGNVIIPYYFSEGGNPVMPEQKFLESAAGFGPVNKLRDDDLVVRDALLVYLSPIGKIIDFSVELIIICNYFKANLGDVSLEGNHVVIDTKSDKKVKISIRENGSMPINYSVTMDDIKTVPFWRFMETDFELDVFKDKIVIVGLTDPAILDVYRTPLGVSSGVDIVANTILTVISGRFIRYVSKDTGFSIILLVMLIMTFIVFKKSTWKSLLYCSMITIMYLCLMMVLSFYGYRFEIFSVVLLSLVIYIVIHTYKLIYLLGEHNYHLQKALNDLKQMQSELVESEKLAVVGRLTAQLSHEIKNPLSAIYNNINTVKYILKHGTKMDKAEEVVDQVINELKRLTKLSQDILSFSRPPKEALRLANLNDIIEKVMDFYGAQLRNALINVSLKLSKDIPLVTVSQDRMEQVFYNIVLNAIDAMPSGGLIEIVTKTEYNRYIEISISDTGVGIPDEIKDRIFNPFFTTKGEDKGTGLGLFTVQNIIRGYGGTINVNKNTPKGTTFIIRLPFERR